MSYYRSYFSKNNTIISNTLTNTAKNSDTNIFYGVNHSRYLFQVDFSNLISKIQDGDLIIDDNTTHTLYFKNTIFGDSSLLHEPTGVGMNRAVSFDLILFVIPEFWDEGTGVDYVVNPLFIENNKVYSSKPSNWFNSTTLDAWTTEGVYIQPNVLQTIHFDNGNEDISVDVTEYVNGVILSGNTDYGLGLAFAPSYEDIRLDNEESVSFFGKYTQTFYEPHIETKVEDTILDDRSNFVAEIEQNLYLYITKGTNYYDLDNLPTVDITDASGTVLSGLGDLEAVKVRKGVYKVTFGLTGTLCDGRRFYYDKWKDISLMGVSMDDVRQKFVPKPYTSLFTLGENPTEFQRYKVQFYGIKQNEKIDQLEIRKITVRFRSIDTPKTDLFHDVHYKLYVLEGDSTQVIVHDWTPLDRTNENSFFLDTTYLIPRTYYLEIKAQIHGEQIFYKDVISFDIVSID
jgi:hypothetical protein